MNRRRPPIAVADPVALRRKVDKPPIIPQKLLCRGSAEQHGSLLGAPGLAAVPLGARQRRSGESDGARHVSPVGPPLLAEAARRICSAVSAYCVVALRRCCGEYASQ